MVKKIYTLLTALSLIGFSSPAYSEEENKKKSFINFYLDLAIQMLPITEEESTDITLEAFQENGWDLYQKSTPRSDEGSIGFDLFPMRKNLGISLLFSDVIIDSYARADIEDCKDYGGGSSCKDDPPYLLPLFSMYSLHTGPVFRLFTSSHENILTSVDFGAGPYIVWLYFDKPAELILNESYEDQQSISWYANAMFTVYYYVAKDISFFFRLGLEGKDSNVHFPDSSEPINGTTFLFKLQAGMAF